MCFRRTGRPGFRKSSGEIRVFSCNYSENHTGRIFPQSFSCLLPCIKLSLNIPCIHLIIIKFLFNNHNNSFENRFIYVRNSYCIHFNIHTKFIFRLFSCYIFQPSGMTFPFCTTTIPSTTWQYSFSAAFSTSCLLKIRTFFPMRQFLSMIAFSM